MFGDRCQDLVFVGSDLDEPTIAKHLDACLMTDAELGAELAAVVNGNTTLASKREGRAAVVAAACVGGFSWIAENDVEQQERVQAALAGGSVRSDVVTVALLASRKAGLAAFDELRQRTDDTVARFTTHGATAARVVCDAGQDWVQDLAVDLGISSLPAIVVATPGAPPPQAQVFRVSSWREAAIAAFGAAAPAQAVCVPTATASPGGDSAAPFASPYGMQSVTTDTTAIVVSIDDGDALRRCESEFAYADCGTREGASAFPVQLVEDATAVISRLEQGVRRRWMVISYIFAIISLTYNAAEGGIRSVRACRAACCFTPYLDYSCRFSQCGLFRGLGVGLKPVSPGVRLGLTGGSAVCGSRAGPAAVRTACAPLERHTRAALRAGYRHIADRSRCGLHRHLVLEVGGSSW